MLPRLNLVSGVCWPAGCVAGAARMPLSSSAVAYRRLEALQVARLTRMLLLAVVCGRCQARSVQGCRQRRRQHTGLRCIWPHNVKHLLMQALVCLTD
jgi:hypothetical protein